MIVQQKIMLFSFQLVYYLHQMCYNTVVGIKVL